MGDRLVDLLAATVNAGKEVNWVNVALLINATSAREKFEGTSEIQMLPLHYAAENKAPLEVVATLLAAYPEAAREKDRWDRFPLHFAIKNDAPPEVVAALLAAYPEAARQKHGDGRLPLHFAAEEKAPLKVVAALLAAYPEAAREKDREGKLPLHNAAYNKAPLEVVAALLAAYPEASGEKANNGSFPLHYAAEIEAPLEVVAALFAAYPEAAREKDKEGLLPLHRAIRRDASPEVVAALRAAMSSLAEARLQTYLDAAKARKRDKEGLPALHQAVFEGASFSVLEAIIAAYPEAAREKDKEGRLPLHHAATSKALEVVAALLAAYPEAAREKDVGGRFPLHFAAASKAPLEVVAALLAAYPQAAREKDQEGKLSLNYAMEKKAPVEVVAALLAAYPEAAREKDKEGKLPLHLAIMMDASLEVVAALLAAYPEAAREKDRKGMLPLHFAAKNKAPPEVVAALLAAFPEAAKEKDKDGWLPLHFAASCQALLEVVAALLVAYPEAAREKDDKGMLPIHYANKKNASPEVVTALRAVTEARLQTYLDAAAAGLKDDQGRTALHQAIFEGSPVSVLVAIITAYPETAREKDNDEFLPLHVAIANKAPLEIVAALLAAYPEAAREKHGGGRLPLHFASQYKAPLEVVAALLAAYPEAVSEKDHYGMFPLHDAIEYKAPFEVVAALLAAYPEAARGKSRNGQFNKNRRLPLHFAAGNKAPLEVVAALLAACPEAARENDDRGWLPLHHTVEKSVNPEVIAALLAADLPILPDADVSPAPNYAYSWTWCIDRFHTGPEMTRKMVEGVFKHFNNSQAHCLALAHTKDAAGREAINLAHPEVQQLMYSYIFFCGRYELQAGPPIHRSATAVVLAATDHGVTKEYEAVFAAALEADIAHRTPSNELSLEGFRHALKQLDPSSSFADKADEHFASFDKNHSFGLAKEEFLSFAATLLGKERKVAIKFMRNEDQFLRERNTRSKFKLNPGFVVGLLEPPPPELYARQVASLVHDGRPLRDYSHALVMPAATRSLDAIFRSERPDLLHVRTMTKELALALQHCHAQRVVHGDVKMLNALRIAERIALIDLDAACVFDSAEPENGDHLGSKFSSGVLPPELFYELKGKEEEAQYAAYWAKEAAAGIETAEQRADAELWAKIAPRCVTAQQGRKRVTRSFVVKTFRTRAVDDNEGSTYDEAVTEGLPYASQLVRASPDVDIWAFGCVLFALAHGEPLLPVNRDDDLSRPEDVLQALSWSDAQLAARLDEMRLAGGEAALVRDLLGRIFRARPADRLRSMDEVLAHGFFRGGGDGAGGMAEVLSKLDRMEGKLDAIEATTQAILGNTLDLKDMSSKMSLQMRRTERVLLNAAVEGVDVTVPSCGLIVGTPYLPLGSAEKQSEEEATQAANARLSFMGSLMKMDFGGMKDAASAKAVMAQEMALSAKDRMGGGPHTMQGDCFYWYLVDEVTMQAVVPPCCSHRRNAQMPPGHCDECVYPVKLYLKDAEWEKSHKMLLTAIPLMQLTLKAAKVYNLASGLATMVGYPVPKIPAAYIDKADAAVGGLSKESTVTEYAALNARLKGASAAAALAASVTGGGGGEADEKAAQAVRGAALTELRAFLHDKGIGTDGNYMGLRRVAASGSGKVIWTTEESVARMEAEAEREAAGGPSEHEKEVAVLEQQKAQLERRIQSRDEALSRLSVAVEDDPMP